MRILVAPLNWGLGHATRCIPIINTILDLGYDPIIAGDGLSFEFLRSEFPDLSAHQLPHLNINYASSDFRKGMLRQSPEIVKSIFSDKYTIGKICKSFKVDGIISDSRMGCFNKGIPSVFLSHQINVMFGSGMMEKIMRKTFARLIRSFDEIWVPDYAGEDNLSGDLSHREMPLEVKYIGPLSRFERKLIPEKRELLVILSGPEPQRTLLESSIMSQLRKMKIEVKVVRGIPEKYTKDLPSNVTVLPLVKTDQLNELICSSKYVLCRAGYSSIMDLAKLRKKAILIPTPGQTEQEYLATHLENYLLFHIQSQDDLDIPLGLESLAYQRHPKSKPPSQLRGEDIIIDWINGLTPRLG